MEGLFKYISCPRVAASLKSLSKCNLSSLEAKLCMSAKHCGVTSTESAIGIELENLAGEKLERETPLAQSLSEKPRYVPTQFHTSHPHPPNNPPKHPF